MKHISMDLPGIEECPRDIQISGGAREIKDITPHPHPGFLAFFIYGPIFMKLNI